MHRFAFNLIPEKPKELVEKEQKRENTSLTLAFLPFIAVILSIIVIVVNYLFIDKNIQAWDEAILRRESEIEAYQNIIGLNVEYSQKTLLLEEPVALDVSPQDFFDISNRIVNNLPFEAVISSYGRVSDGSFDIVVVHSDVTNAHEIIRAFELSEDILYPNLKFVNTVEEVGADDSIDLGANVTTNKKSEIQTTINFVINKGEEIGSEPTE